MDYFLIFLVIFATLWIYLSVPIYNIIFKHKIKVSIKILLEEDYPVIHFSVPYHGYISVDSIKMIGIIFISYISLIYYYICTGFINEVLVLLILFNTALAFYALSDSRNNYFANGLKAAAILGAPLMLSSTGGEPANIGTDVNGIYIDVEYIVANDKVKEMLNSVRTEF